MRNNPLKQPVKESYRFSGHETFACRYAWLPKAAQQVSRDSTLLTPSREDDAMVMLGVGKNMVRSIRFWGEAFGILKPTQQGHQVTDFGQELLLDEKKGHKPCDPYLEDIQTLWLLHWKLSTSVEQPVFAWDFLLSRFHEPELTASSVYEAIKKATQSLDKELSESTLEQQFEIFLHTYVPTRGRKGEVREDNLDCPLVELGLLELVGTRPSRRGSIRDEAAYVFRRESKPEISPELFAYCVDEFWCNRHSDEKTLSFQLLASGRGSPGQVFKLPEDDLHHRVESLARDTDGQFEFKESASVASLSRKKTTRCISLTAIYQSAPTYA